MPQKPPDLDQNFKPITASSRPPDLDEQHQPIQAQTATPTAEPSYEDIMSGAKDTLARVSSQVPEQFRMDTSEPEPSQISKALTWASAPLTDAPTKLAERASHYINPESTTAGIRGIGSAYIEGLGHAVSGLSSPINLAMFGLGGAAGLAGKAGLADIATAAKLGERGLSAAMVPEGAYHMATAKRPDELLSGALEAGMGAWGARGHVGDIAEAAKSDVVPAETPKPDIVSDLRTRLDAQTKVEPTPIKDDSGRVVAYVDKTNLPVEDTRPPGPWAENKPAAEVPKPKPTEEAIYDIARQKQKMGLEPPPAETKPETGNIARIGESAAKGEPFDWSTVVKTPHKAEAPPPTHTIEDLQRIANREGDVDLYHGTTAENAESILKEGVKLPQSGEEAAKAVADKYGIPWSEWKAYVEPQGPGAGYGEQPRRLSTASGPIAERWSKNFPQGEILSDLNSKARMWKAAKAQGRTKDIDAFYDEVDAKQKAAGGSNSIYNLPDHAGPGSEDLMKPSGEPGKILKATVDARAIPEMHSKKAKRLLDRVASGEITKEQALSEWNEGYRDIKVAPQNVKRIGQLVQKKQEPIRDFKAVEGGVKPQDMPDSSKWVDSPFSEALRDAPDIRQDLQKGNFRIRPVVPTERMLGTQKTLRSDPMAIPDEVLQRKIDKSDVILRANKNDYSGPPIVSFTPDGKVYIHEGHTRFAKALATKQKVNSVIVDQRPVNKAMADIQSSKISRAEAPPKPPNKPPTDVPPPPGSVPPSEPPRTHLPELDKRRDWTTEILNLPRAIQASYDISFPFRQGLGLIHTKGWWTSWGDMMKSLGSENAYRATMDSILEKPNNRPVKLPDGSYGESFSKKAGLDLTDLVSRREEQMLSSIAEKIPGIRASNRAYTAFANKLRSDVFDSLIEQAEKQGLDPRNNLVLAKQIASYVNAASGRGNLGGLERSANVLAGFFFSPRMIASRLQMGNQILNPQTYAMTQSFVKKQYWKSVLGMAGTWITMASMAKMGGADVSLNPDSADFGKIKIGKTRLDPAGGFQQYIVLASRLMSGKYTSSSSGKTTTYGSRFGAETRKDAVNDFVQNKLAPVPGTIYGGIFGASRKRPFDVTDKAVRLLTPMVLQDISEILQEDPRLLPAAAGTAVGLGVQTYGERGASNRVLPKSILPEVNFRGGSLFR